MLHYETLEDLANAAEFYGAVDLNPGYHGIWVQFLSQFEADIFSRRVAEAGWKTEKMFNGQAWTIRLH